MTRTRSTHLAVFAFLLAPIAAQAVPIQLTETQFNTETSGLTTVVEDFESFSAGTLSSPVTLANSTYTTSIPQIRLNANNNPGNALFENAPDPVSGRMFSNFLPNTNYFGITVNDIFANEGLLDIIVMGGSGTLNVQATFAALNSFFGVTDPLGLTSVSFRNLGNQTTTYAWGMDNVTTAAAAVRVPEPGTLSLLGIGLIGVGVARRRRNA